MHNRDSEILFNIGRLIYWFVCNMTYITLWFLVKTHYFLYIKIKIIKNNDNL